ncbi:TPA: nucleotide sugar dehydrogenase [Pseudomonas aeruginosa]|nr:nucleotide sugar dehydrogenase [Pseudomonas aeruginosa]
MARKTKEESQKTRDGILDAAERVFLEKGVGTTAMADLADAAGVSRGAVYGHYKNKIEVCLAMCDRAFGQIEVPDENARVPALDILLRAGMGFLRQCCEPGSVQRVLEILYLKCERSDENEPLLRRRELLEKQGQRFGLRQIRRAVERGELPARLDVELASIYLQSLWDGICGTLAWTERLRDDPWNRAERMFRAGLDSLRSSPYLLLAVAEQLGAQLRQACIVVNKSTVPVGTAERVEEIIRLGLARRRKRFRVAVASNPEFLKEGSAVDDFRRPDRVIIGSAETQAGETLRQLYAPFLRNHERVLLMGRREAEFSKYAANAFLATKISFMNEMAGLCALTGVDIEDVRRGMGSDKRIGTHFIYAGCGYGGSCFPKDVRALIRSAEQQGFDSQILRAVEARNARQKELLFETLGELFQGRWQGRTVALWGLAFKPGTDDLREAPSLVLLEALLRHGVRVRAHDPVANAGVAARYPDALACAQLTLHDSPYAAVEGADALVLVTEWKQFRQPDFQKIRGSMRTPLLVDGRNLYAPARMAELGFIYQGIGRPRAGHCKASAA